METSFTLHDDSTLDGIFITQAPDQSFDVRRTPRMPTAQHTVSLREWMDEATDALVGALYRRELPLRLAQLWDPVLRDHAALAEAVQAKRDAFQRARASLQQTVEASEPARAREIAAQRDRCAHLVRVAAVAIAEAARLRVAHIAAAAQTRQNAAHSYAEVIESLHGMHERFGACNSDGGAWGARIAEVIREEHARHCQLAARDFDSTTSTEAETHSAPPRADEECELSYGNPHIDRLAALGLQVAELQALHELVAAFEAVAPLLGRCGCLDPASCRCPAAE